MNSTSGQNSDGLSKREMVALRRWVRSCCGAFFGWLWWKGEDRTTENPFGQGQ